MSPHRLPVQWTIQPLRIAKGRWGKRVLFLPCAANHLRGHSMSPELPRKCYAFPPFIDFGTCVAGARVDGAFQIGPATTLQRIDSVSGREILCIHNAYHDGDSLVCQFTLNGLEPGTYHQGLRIVTDGGEATFLARATFVPQQTAEKWLLLSPSPFSWGETQWARSNLGYLLREHQVGLHALDELPDDDLSNFAVLVLWDHGLAGLGAADHSRIERALETGSRVLLIASKFVNGSLEAANVIARAWGLEFADREYGEVICRTTEIDAHSANDGIRALRWFRPTPILVQNPARFLVRNPQNHSEAFAACSGPHDNLFVLGASSIEDLLCVGWPYDNNHFLANLLRPGPSPPS